MSMSISSTTFDATSTRSCARSAASPIDALSGPTRLYENGFGWQPSFDRLSPLRSVVTSSHHDRACRHSRRAALTRILLRRRTGHAGADATTVFVDGFMRYHRVHGDRTARPLLGQGHTHEFHDSGSAGRRPVVVFRSREGERILDRRHCGRRARERRDLGALLRTLCQTACWCDSTCAATGSAAAIRARAVVDAHPG